MSLPAFAEVDDLAVRIPGGIKDEDEPRAQAALDDASALIRALTGMTWESDFPDIVHTVTLWSARRSFENPAQLTQETVSGWSGTFANASPDVYLTSNEKRLVLRAAGQTGVGVLPTSRGDILETSRDPYWTGDGSGPPGTGITDPKTGTQYVPVDDSEPIPWVGPDGF